MSLPRPAQADGWIRIRWFAVAMLCSEALPEAKRWRLEKALEGEHPKLLLVSGRGTRWLVRIQGGTYIKPYEPSDQTP